MSSQLLSERRLPQFIHIKGRSPLKSQETKSNNALANASHPPPSTPPPKSLFKTPTKNKTSVNNATPPTSNARRRNIRGILKSPSYKFTGIRVSPRKSKNNNPTTPETVETNFSENDSISRSSSCGSSTIGSVATFNTTSTEGIEKALEKIIDQSTKSNSSSSNTNDTNNNNNNDNTNNNSTSNRSKSLRSMTTSSSASIDSNSTSSTSASTFSSNSKEEHQRCARIKHIEDLKERIDHAKARKLVERKAYRREDKLLLRLARQLKTISRKSRENTINMTILEESNQYSEECYQQSLEELEEWRAARILLNEQLRAEMQSKLEAQREQWNRILRVQDAELKAHKRNHQCNCQALCESVLNANNDLDRMRALWEEHMGTANIVQKSRSNNRGRLWVAMVVFIFILKTIIVLSTRRTSTTTATITVEQNDRSLPPLNMIRKGILRDDDDGTTIDLDFPTRFDYDEIQFELETKICKIVSNQEEKANPTCHSVEKATRTTTKQQGEKGKRRFKQVLSNIFRHDK